MDTSIVPQPNENTQPARIGGIYQWRQLSTGKKYIGSTNDFERRKKEHIKELRRRGHANLYLLRAWESHGSEDFIFEILEVIEDKSSLLDREQWYLDNTVLWGFDFNGVKIACLPPSMLGKKHSDEAKQAISKGNSKREKSPEEIERWKAAYWKNRNEFPERYEKAQKVRADAHKGKIISEEHKRNIAQAHKDGKYSADTVAKRVATMMKKKEARKGVSIKRDVPDEERERRSASAKEMNRKRKEKSKKEST